MKRWTIACALVASLVFAGGALGHEDEHSGKRNHPSGDGQAGALGSAGNPGEVTRDVEVEMSDAMRFRPDRIRVRDGETIRFLVRNNGRLVHEMVLGTMEELREHAAAMRKSPGMRHAEPNQVSVPPGKTGELIWRFTRSGTVPFACLQPGHFEAGMTGEVEVGREAK